MTLNELKASRKELLTPSDVCGVLHCAPYALTQTAREHPELLKFPYAMIGNRLKIPRVPFIEFMEGRGNGAE